MSPLACSLLALACAALLHAACAQQQLQCTNARQGVIGGTDLRLNDVIIDPYYGPSFSFPVEDWCAREQLPMLRAEYVQACDDVQPLVQISENGLTISVQRRGTMALEMRIVIMQYCY